WSLKLHLSMLLVGVRLGEAVRGHLARIRLDDHPEGELDALPFGLPLDDLESGLRRVSHGREGTEHFDRNAHRQLLEGGSRWTRSGPGAHSASITESDDRMAKTKGVNP